MQSDRKGGRKRGPASSGREGPAPQDSISETMDKAKKDGKELGSKLEDTLNNQLPQLFDDAMNLFRDQMRQYNKEKPEAPTNL